MRSGWGPLVTGVAVLWVIVAAAWAPLLRSPRLRSLFASWPTDRLGPNYLLLSAAVVAGQATAYLARVVVSGTLGGVELVRWTLGVAAGYPAGLWLLVVAVTAATGRWEPPDERRRRWLALGLGALWYAVVVVVAALLVFFGLFVMFFPG